MREFAPRAKVLRNGNCLVARDREFHFKENGWEGGGIDPVQK